MGAVHRVGAVVEGQHHVPGRNPRAGIARSRRVHDGAAAQNRSRHSARPRRCRRFVRVLAHLPRGQAGDDQEEEDDPEADHEGTPVRPGTPRGASGHDALADWRIGRVAVDLLVRHPGVGGVVGLGRAPRVGLAGGPWGAGLVAGPGVGVRVGVLGRLGLRGPARDRRTSSGGVRRRSGGGRLRAGTRLVGGDGACASPGVGCGAGAVAVEDVACTDLVVVLVSRAEVSDGSDVEDPDVGGLAESPGPRSPPRPGRGTFVSSVKPTAPATTTTAAQKPRANHCTRRARRPVASTNTGSAAPCWDMAGTPVVSRWAKKSVPRG